MLADLTSWLVGIPWTSMATLFIDLAIKSSLVCIVASASVLALRRASAFVRSAVWIGVIAGLLVLPALAIQSPVWNVPIMPALGFLDHGAYQPEAEKEVPGTIGMTPVEKSAAAASGSAALEPTSLPLPWYAWGILAWLAGGLLYLCWNLILHAGVRSVVHRAVPADRRWTALLDGIADELALRRNVTLLESSQLKAAVTVGIVDPVIVVPASCEDWPVSRRRLVLSHELAHVKRWDTLTEMFALFATIVYWFNPFVWYAVRRLRIERETDCDNAVLRTGARPSEYAELLMNIAADLSASTRPAWQLSTISQGSNVKDRLMDILNQRVNRSRGSRRSAIITVGLALALVLPISTSGLWSDATSQTKDKVEQEKKASDHPEKAEWDSMTDEQKKAYKAQKKAEWDAMTPEQKSQSMFEKVCTSDNSAACIVGKKMKAHGVEAGLKAFQKMKDSEEGTYVFKEKEFNSLGYAFLYVEKTDEAIAVLELNMREYPDSWNCYDSLGEAYMVAKKYDESSKYYQMAVNMNPESDHSREQLEKLQTLIAASAN